MTEYQKVELKKPGDALVMRIDYVFFNPKSEKHKYPNFTFKGVSDQGWPVMLYVPENSVRRQFSWAPFNIDTETDVQLRAAKGLTVRFWRKPNPEDETKPYWNVSAVDMALAIRRPAVPGHDPDAPPVGDRPAESNVGAARATLHDGVGLYQWAWNAAKDVQGEAGTPESIQAGAATLVIWADKRGIGAVPKAPKRIPSPFHGPPEPDEDDGADEDDTGMPF